MNNTTTCINNNVITVTISNATIQESISADITGLNEHSIQAKEQELKTMLINRIQQKTKLPNMKKRGIRI